MEKQLAQGGKKENKNEKERKDFDLFLIIYIVTGDEKKEEKKDERQTMFN
jgi:hypothetical protein